MGPSVFLFFNFSIEGVLMKCQAIESNYLYKIKFKEWLQHLQSILIHLYCNLQGEGVLSFWVTSSEGYSQINESHLRVANHLGNQLITETLWKFIATCRFDLPKHLPLDPCQDSSADPRICSHPLYHLSYWAPKVTSISFFHFIHTLLMVCKYFFLTICFLLNCVS